MKMYKKFELLGKEISEYDNTIHYVSESALIGNCNFQKYGNIRILLKHKEIPVTIIASTVKNSYQGILLDGLAISINPRFLSTITRYKKTSKKHKPKIILSSASNKSIKRHLKKKHIEYRFANMALKMINLNTNKEIR